MRQHTYGAKSNLSQLKSQLQLISDLTHRQPLRLCLPSNLLEATQKYMRNILSKRLAAIIGLALAAAVAAWQFYLFVVFKDVNGVADAQGGRMHLWVAIGIALMTCIGGVFLISQFLSYDRRNEMHITSQGHPAGVGKD